MPHHIQLQNGDMGYKYLFLFHRYHQRYIWKKEVINNTISASMKTAIKNVEKAVIAKDKTKATETLAVAIKRIDKAQSSGLIHKNKAARLKSRLTKTMNNMESAN